MTDVPMLQTERDVQQAFTDPLLVPPPPPDGLRPGPTADLRAAMARFLSGPDHPAPRLAVEAAVEDIDLAALSTAATEQTAHLLDRLVAGGPGAGTIDALHDIGFVAPTRAMACVLGVDEESLDPIVADVAEMVLVIGRGEPSSERSDLAVTRLLERFDGGDDGSQAVATVSLLYQNHDATAALIAANLVAGATGAPRRSPLAKTVRVATQQTTVGERSIDAGTLVALSIEAPTHQFGAGPHRCPGREAAETIADAVVQAIADAGVELRPEGISYGPDGRATSLPLTPTGQPSSSR